LAALPKENLEITQRYAGDATSLAYVSGYISQETGLLARQAAEIANRLPRDQVTSSEYHAVALTLWNAGDAASALPFAARAVESATDAASAANALRAHAGDLFSLGQFEEGRRQYQAALDLFDKYPGYSDYFQKSTHFVTQSAWAVWEANSGFRDLAEEHVAAAESIVSQLPPGSGTDQMHRQIEQQRSILDATGRQ
jgi:tetratricopeptide (TPR) repeat protein